MSDKFDRQSCISLLKEKKKELDAAGDDRFPKRSDFTEDQIVAIKAFLGPWPRALEESGLKQADPNRETDKMQKRIALKRKKTEIKKVKKGS